MLKTLLAFAVTLLLANQSQSQNYSWITPNKTYLKLYVADDGVYRISRTDFTNAGINTSGIDPRTVKVYNKGNQIPVFFQGESDGVFDANDYLDFYGIRNYGGISKTYNEDNSVVYSSNEYYDFYSDTNVYWIDWGGANGIRMQTSAYSTTTPFANGYYNDFVHLEKDKMYWIGENNAQNGNFTNERYKGESWYWNLLYNGQSLSDTFSTPLLYTTPQDVSLRIFAYPQTINQFVMNEHTLTIKINSNVVATFVRNDYTRVDTTITFSSSLLSNSSVNTVRADYSSPSGGTMFFDLFEFNYPKFFKFRNNLISIFPKGSDTSSALYKITGYVAGNALDIYDVTTKVKITAFSNSLDTLKFTGRSNSRFEIINKTNSKKPVRIIQKQVPDLVSAGNGADYLIVYNKLFYSQVLQLKNHRETYDNFRVSAAEIEDIYDVFNYGIENPVAVRNLVRHIYYNWQQPRIKYVCLFGRASLDPKKNSTSSVYYKNLVPTYGNPSSDNYFANVNTGGFTFYNNVSIGRLPAYTSTEAQYIINNIFTYELQSPQSWWKDFTFIAGGTTSFEQDLFKKSYDSLINRYVTKNPVYGNPVRIMRNDLIGEPTFNYSDSIKDQIDRGTLTVNFVGHAGSQDWEIGMSDPNVLSNYDGKFPLVMSMTCYTGKIGEPTERAFGEKFMTMNNKGAIGYIGTAGWGFVFAGDSLSHSLYRSIISDTLRRIGDIFSKSIYNQKNDSLNFAVRHTINCYTLQGDPAAMLVLPARPEFSITNNDYKLSDYYPMVNTPVTLTIYPKNYGLYSDSCKIRMQILKNGYSYLIKDTSVYSFKNSDSAKYSFKLDSNGTYSVKITLDILNTVPYENKSNNIIEFDLTTRSISFLPIKPYDNSIIKADSVELTGLNPFVDRTKHYIKLLLELDTTTNFNSALKKTFATTSISGVSNKFKTLLPVLDTNVIYFWRTNSIVDNDSTGWSNSFRFRYNPGASYDSRYSRVEDTTQIFYIDKPAQYSITDFFNTNISSDGVKMNTYPMQMYVRSLGSNGSEASFFNVGEKSIHIDGGYSPNMGLSLLKVRKLDGAFVQHKVFKMRSSTSSDSVLAFLNTFDSTHYLMGLNSSYVDDANGHFLLNQNTLNKIHQFGCTKIDTVRKFGWYDTWSFIGYLGATPAQVSESVHRFINSWNESTSSLTKTFSYPLGTVTYLCGSANSWKDFSWQQMILSGSVIKFDVYGIDKNSQQNLLYSDITTNLLTDLSSINSKQYPNLNLVGKLIIDTLSGLSSPSLNTFKLDYTPSVEIVPDLSTFWQSDTSSSPGREIKIRFNYSNAGEVSANGMVLRIYQNSATPNFIIKTDTINKVLKPDSTLFYEGKFTVPYFRTANSKFIVEISAKSQPEQYIFNNYIYRDIKISYPKTVSAIELYSDGALVKSGDYVSLKPEFKIQINNENVTSGNDVHSIELLLNDKVVRNGSNSDKYSKSGNYKSEERFVKDNDENELTYHPALIAGNNRVMIRYTSKSGNSDSAEYDLIVSDQMLVKDFYNFPNPMRTETDFIFNLAGLEKPETCKIRIYSINGRLIKEIRLTPQIGFNKVHWDGKDNDGDFIANGTYLYKLVAEDNSQTETSVQKLVVLK